MKVITFGEIMLRLAPEGYLRFVQADKYMATFGGGEANVAVSAANYGLDSVYVTKLPAHGGVVGQYAQNGRGQQTFTRTGGTGDGQNLPGIDLHAEMGDHGQVFLFQSLVIHLEILIVNLSV